MTTLVQQQQQQQLTGIILCYFITIIIVTVIVRTIHNAVKMSRPPEVYLRFYIIRITLYIGTKFVNDAILLYVYNNDDGICLPACIAAL